MKQESGRTDTIPMVDNEEGLCLLTGFSQNAMKVAADKKKKDPYEALIAALDSPRYHRIEEAIKDVVAQAKFQGMTQRMTGGGVALRDMDKAISNFRMGEVSQPIDLSD